jgi:hypothetical protein
MLMRASVACGVAAMGIGTVFAYHIWRTSGLSGVLLKGALDFQPP